MLSRILNKNSLESDPKKKLSQTHLSGKSKPMDSQSTILIKTVENNSAVDM